MLNFARLVPLLLSLQFASSAIAQAPEAIHVDAQAQTTPFPHFWEQTFGSGRAILSLRESYRNDLRTVKQATGFQQIRFHGILMDEVGLYDPNRVTKNPGLAAEAAHDTSAYNFTYINEIYDGLLANGVHPYVELSFTPKQMASDPNALHPFWYHPNVSQPKNYDEWDRMIRAFAEHVIARYGIAEVATWKFEVWNEPNLDFWAGNPKQQTYWELYDHTARALKAVSPKLQVGGPSTAQAAWVDAFLAHAKSANVPVDFVSTHVYANDQAKDVFGTNENIPRDVMVYRSVKKVRDQITASAFPNLPLYFSEYNASYANEPNVTDTSYMGPWVANTIRLCDGLVQDMAYWAFSDVFEEQGVNRTPFYGGFGLVAADGIPKASLNAFRMLHTLGDRRIAVASDSALATQSNDAVTIALWNYAPPAGTGATYTAPPASLGPDKHFKLQLDHVAKNAKVEVLRVDSKHGDANTAFDAMKRPPADLTRDQVAQLRAAGAMSPAEHTHLSQGAIEIVVPAQGLVVLRITR
ncbi:GH39 family glycosyl hydrolase [Terriglobus roseus]|uniref:Xylan 1,4-beta-xylosidase n=1 Tax=Terriglobus roseus TaxID=392734 RepID=A0A1H4IX43_9BACT|nr:glycosyl hydrolase family 39 [Terriglobus roseus]SEB38547.1 xylan 1,4-beta-xylosidase [Terriglobus roseus]